MRSGASGAGCLDASFAVSAMRAHECRFHAALSIIAPSVNVLRHAPETIDDQRRCARCRYRTIYGGSRGSASLPAPAREACRRVGVLAYRRLRRRVFATCGTVGTRSRAIRGSTSDDRVGCSASDARCAPARPALDVSTRLLPFLPCAFTSADGMRPFP